MDGTLTLACEAGKPTWAPGNFRFQLLAASAETGVRLDFYDQNYRQLATMDNVLPGVGYGPVRDAQGRPRPFFSVSITSPVNQSVTLILLSGDFSFDRSVGDVAITGGAVDSIGTLGGISSNVDVDVASMPPELNPRYLTAWSWSLMAQQIVWGASGVYSKTGIVNDTSTRRLFITSMLLFNPGGTYTLDAKIFDPGHSFTVSKRPKFKLNGADCGDFGTINRTDSTKSISGSSVWLFWQGPDVQRFHFDRPIAVLPGYCFLVETKATNLDIYAQFEIDQEVI